MYLFFMSHVRKEIFLKWFQSFFEPVLKGASVQMSPAFWRTFQSFSCQWQNLENMIVFVHIINDSQDLFVNKTMLKLCHDASVFYLLMMFQFLESRVYAPQKSNKRHIIFEVGCWKLKIFQNVIY